MNSAPVSFPTVPTRPDVWSVADAVAAFFDRHGRPPVILKDMDNTDYDWSGRFNEVLLRHDPTFPVVPAGHRTGYDHFAVGDHDPDVITRALLDPDLYRDMDPMPGAVEATHKLLDAGCVVFFVTTPELNNPGCVQGKVDDIRRDYGPGMLNHLILTRDKTVVFGDVLIDDKPDISGAVPVPAWRHVLQDQDFNAWLDHPLRMHGWTDLERVLPAALKLTSVTG